MEASFEVKTAAAAVAKVAKTKTTTRDRGEEENHTEQHGIPSQVK